MISGQWLVASEKTVVEDLYGSSIARDLLSPSLITQLIVVHSLDPNQSFDFR